jgi:hypothetical protein
MCSCRRGGGDWKEMFSRNSKQEMFALQDYGRPSLFKVHGRQGWMCSCRR